MMLPDPSRAPARTDLPWLRHRPVRRVPAAAATRVDLRHAGRPAPGARPASAGLDLSRPTREAAPASSSLDLSAPAPAQPAPSPSLDLSSPAPARPSPSLDLSSAPAAPASARPAPSLDLGSSAAPAPASLDLSSAAAPSQVAPARRRPSAARGDEVLGYAPEGVVVGRPTLLTRDRPTIALTAVQSGVGVLRVTSAVSQGVGDFRLAAFAHLATGETVLLDHNRAMTTVPAASRRPVVQAVDRGFLVDLRQTPRLARLVVLGFSPTSAALAWSGALRVETIGGARVDVPLEREPGAGSLVALSLVNVGGRLVLRAERELVPGALREAALAFGFDELTWVDAWTPLV
ncbi:hypothetical protein [Cellulomonas rhizosphaerae]|uniref:Uncharacterized protein n=1 Tax=Cellulomonas rhizosphaerae TaxID=2293719 RepID=A0A413RRD6_9CELL|nr:hypothetical protein [Cellulomonas rhizosphaerae]RHA44562.1 hypothetical protein D1825_00595 [Cellulomonas rhizosphaerae]